MSPAIRIDSDPHLEGVPPTDPRESADGSRSGSWSASWPRVERWERIALAGILAVFGVLVVSLIAGHAPLGWDESVYAQRARHYAAGPVDAGYWNDYRAEGLPVMMRLAWPLDHGDAALRLVAAGLAAALVVLTWVWGRSIFSRAVGIVAAGLVALTPGFVQWAWQIALDIPGAAFGIAAVAVFTLASRGERVRWWALAAVPLAVAATYVRYGAPTLVAAGMTVVALAHWRAVRRSLVVVGLTAAGTAGGMLAVLLVPAVTNSDRAPWAAFHGRQVEKEISGLASYADFGRLLDDLLGPVIGLVVVAGTVAVVVAVTRRQLHPIPVAVAFGGLALWFVGLNWGLSEGFLVYATPGVPLLMVGVAAGLVAAGRRMPRVVLAGILVTLVPVAAFLALDEASVLDDKLHRSFDPLRAASLALEDRTGGDCAVVTSFSPQAGWYSQCESVGFSRGEASNRGEFERSFRDRVVRAFPGLTSDVPVFLLLADEGKRQPTGEELSWLHDMTGPTIIEIGSPDDGRLQHVEVFDMGTLADFRARGADGG